jgi:hypothetical protein
VDLPKIFTHAIKSPKCCLDRRFSKDFIDRQGVFATPNFYFDRADLMSENQVLVEEIATLTEMVSDLREIVDAHKAQQTAKRTKRVAER